MTALPIERVRKLRGPPGPRKPIEGCSVADFAASRKLTIGFLERELAWSDADWHGTPCIEIPYIGRDGAMRATRYRIALRAKDRFRWAAGTRQCAYEPDRGAASRAQHYVIMVEGESDTATLLAAGFPALGIPGAAGTHVIESEHLAELERIFIVREPGDAGGVFVAGARERIKDLAFAGGVHELRMPQDAKDPSDLYVRDPDAFPALLCAALETAKLPARPAYRTLSESIAQTMRPLGERLSTGFSMLDQATRGGIPMGRVVVFAGAPGAAKTGLAVYLANRWERSGCAVVFLAADEPAEGIITRIGQLEGWSRDSLESEGDIGDSVRAGFACASADRCLAVIDPDADESMATIEAAEQALLHFAHGRPRVLVIDSLQTARCAAAAGAESARERIDATIGVAKAIAKRGALVVAVSEMSRAGYRSGSRSENISALAAGKESGSIEYGAALLLGLRSVAGETGLVDVEVAKNRLGGSKPEFRLRLDFDRASFEEVVRPDGEDEPDKGELKFQRACDRLRSCLRQHHDISSQRELVRRAGGTAADNAAAFQKLVTRGEIVKSGDVLRLAAAEL